MKFRFYCGADDWTRTSSFDVPGECSGEVIVYIDRDIFEEEGVTIICPECGSRLDQYNAEEIKD